MSLIDTFPKIVVVGVGGVGCRVVSAMAQSGINHVDFIAADSDVRDLDDAQVERKLRIGSDRSHAAGISANPEIDRSTTLEHADEIKSILSGSDIVFVVASMGGGMGTGGAPVFTRIAREAGALTIAIAKPLFYDFDEMMSKDILLEGIAELKRNADALIIVPNILLNDMKSAESLLDALKQTDKMVISSMKGIIDVVAIPDKGYEKYQEIKAMMPNGVTLAVGMGLASGVGRAGNAARMAISKNVTAGKKIKGSEKVLVSLIGGRDLEPSEYDDVVSVINKAMKPGADIIYGSMTSPEMNGQIMVTIYADGFEDQSNYFRVRRPEMLRWYGKGKCEGKLFRRVLR